MLTTLLPPALLAAALAAPPAPLPASGPDSWARTRDAVAAEDWVLALGLARQCLMEDGDFAGGKLVEAMALHKLRRHQAAMRAFGALEDHEQLGDYARQQRALYDNRWRRDLPSLSLGLGLYDDRGVNPRALKPTFTAELEAPVVWRFNVRADLTTGWQEEDGLALQGPQLGLLAVFQQPIDIWGVDVGVGPTLALGKSAYWQGAVGGPLPGVRAAVGGSVRPLKNVGGRVEVGWSGVQGVWPMLNDWSSGFDTRLMVTGWVW